MSMSFNKTLKALFVLGLWLYSNLSSANDTLLYRSAFEERLVKKALRDADVNFMALYSAINSDSIAYQKYVSRLNGFYAIVNEKVRNAKSGKQIVKLLFKEVHSYFFRQYQENVLFSKIFEEGTYNCLTASILYSIVLKNYDIPFEIKEKPTHVYLVAFPGADNILLETTSPQGFYVPDEKAKQEYVAALVSMKFTTQEYVNSKGVANAFNEFYYNNESIGLKQLAALQYYNEAVSGYDEDIHEAIKSAIKTNMLYPCPKHQFLKSSLIGTAISNSEFESVRDILYLCEFANSSRDVKDKKNVKATFAEILDNKLLKNGNDTLVAEAFAIIQEKIEDKDLLNEITYIYYAGFGYWQAMQGNMDKSLLYSEKAFAINNRDVRLHDMIVRAIALRTEKLKGSDTGISLLHEYTVKFPFLKSHKTFKALLVFQYAYRAYGLFLENSETEGYKYLKMMETELQSNEMAVIAEEMVGMVYAEAGAFHFRKRNYKKAREILLKGLAMVPDHGEIKERLKIVDEEEKR